MSEKNCPLCNMEKKTRWYYEGKLFIICDCETCNMPMIVSKGHVSNISVAWHDYIEAIIKRVFKCKSFDYRKEQKKILSHWHWHLIFK